MVQVANLRASRLSSKGSKAVTTSRAERPVGASSKCPSRRVVTPLKPTACTSGENLDSCLDNIPLNYIRDKLLSNGYSMLAAAGTCKITAPERGTLPKELEVIMHDSALASGSLSPSHCVAVYNPARREKRRATLFPVHSLCLLANCAKLPSFPTTSETVKDESTLSLPVVPFPLPSPETFGLLLAYLYTKDTSSFRQFWAVDAEDTLRQRRKFALARGVFQNCSVLGVQDQALYTMLHQAMSEAASCGGATEASS